MCNKVIVRLYHCKHAVNRQVGGFISVISVCCRNCGFIIFFFQVTIKEMRVLEDLPGFQISQMDSDIFKVILLSYYIKIGGGFIKIVLTFTSAISPFSAIRRLKGLVISIWMLLVNYLQTCLTRTKRSYCEGAIKCTIKEKVFQATFHDQIL